MNCKFNLQKSFNFLTPTGDQRLAELFTAAAACFFWSASAAAAQPCRRLGALVPALRNLHCPLSTRFMVRIARHVDLKCGSRLDLQTFLSIHRYVVQRLVIHFGDNV